MSYLVINDDEMLPGRPGKTSLFFRLRDNAIGIAQGDVGAPRILAGAFGTPAAGTRAHYYKAGLHYNALTWNSTPYVLDASYYVAEVTGTFRLITYHALGTASAYQVHKNGLPVGVERTLPGGGTGSYTEDFALVAGDIITVVFRGETGGSGGQLLMTIASDKPAHFPLISKLS